MEGNKKWFESSAVWGGFIAVVAPIMGAAFKVTVTADDVRAIADVCALLGSSVGGTVAVLGRIKANSKIG